MKLPLHDLSNLVGEEPLTAALDFIYADLAIDGASVGYFHVSCDLSAAM